MRNRSTLCSCFFFLSIIFSLSLSLLSFSPSPAGSIHTSQVFCNKSSVISVSSNEANGENDGEIKMGKVETVKIVFFCQAEARDQPETQKATKRRMEGNLCNRTARGRKRKKCFRKSNSKKKEPFGPFFLFLFRTRSPRLSRRRRRRRRVFFLLSESHSSPPPPPPLPPPKGPQSCCRASSGVEVAREGGKASAPVLPPRGCSGCSGGRAAGAPPCCCCCSPRRQRP